MIDLNASVRLPAVLERRLARLAFDAKTRAGASSRLISATGCRLRRALICSSDRPRRAIPWRNIATGASGIGWPKGKAWETLLIHSSLKGGNFSDGLTLAAELLAARRKIIDAVIGALSYPTMLGSALIIFLYVISAVVMPQMTAITDPEQWNGPAALIYRVSLFVNSPSGVVVLIAFFLSIAFIVATLPRWTGKGRRWADKIPPWSIYRLLVGVSWLHTVATLMSAGQKLVDILDSMIKDNNTTPYMRAISRRLLIHASRGANLGDALEATKLHWPDRVLVDELQAYANLPGFSQQIRSIATDWLNEGIGMIVQASRILNVLCISLLGLLIIFMAMSVGSIVENIIHGMGM